MLHHLEYTRNRIASAVLLFYWLFVLATQSIKLRTLVLEKLYAIDPLNFGLFVASTALSLVIFVMENIHRPKSQYVLLEEDEHDCPEPNTNIFGRLTFSWMTPLMRLGYREPLTADDLW